MDEERRSEVESAQRAEAAAMRTPFELIQRIDANMTNLVMLVQALETNFSLLNAKFAAPDTTVAAPETSIAGLETKFDALDTKFTVIDTKLDQILALLRGPDSGRPH